MRKTPEEKAELAYRVKTTSLFWDLSESGKDVGEWIKEMNKDRVYLSMVDSVQEIRMGPSETIFLPRSAQDDVETFAATATKVHRPRRRLPQLSSATSVRVRGYRRRR